MALTDFWLAPKTLQAVKAGMEAGADYVEALAVEAEGAPKQELTTFMALVAAKQGTVTECFGG